MWSTISFPLLPSTLIPKGVVPGRFGLIYDISTIVSYLMPHPLYTYILNIHDIDVALLGTRNKDTKEELSKKKI